MCNIVGVGASIDRLWPEYLTVFPTRSKYDALHRPPSVRGAGLCLESESNPDALPPGARLARRLHRPATTTRKRLSSPSGFAEPWVAAPFRPSHPGSCRLRRWILHSSPDLSTSTPAAAPLSQTTLHTPGRTRSESSGVRLALGIFVAIISKINSSILRGVMSKINRDK